MSAMQNSSVCVDANLIVRILVPGQFTDEARALFELWQNTEIPLLAPVLLDYEVSATLRRMVHLKTISVAEGDKAFAAFNTMSISLSNEKLIHRLAWYLAKEFKQPRTYDMTYLALAEQHNCPFWTADERLYNSVRHQLPWVHWIGSSVEKR